MRGRTLKRAVLALTILALLLAVAAAAVGWLFSNRILVPRPYGLQPEFEIRAVGEGTVTLPAPPEDPPQFARTEARGVYGLRYEGGAGRLGPPQSSPGAGEDVVVRGFQLEEGRPPRAGDAARLDVTVFRSDPSDRGLSFEEVALDGAPGPLPAWWLNAGAESAALMLHGRRRADRTEALRSLPIYREAGLSVLVASYRNHDASPPSPDGLYHYGLSEAEDALVAARFLADQGVSRVVLVGLSMGAAVALEALERWPEDAPAPAALVLEAPLVDVRGVIRHGARSEGFPVPDRLADLALAVASLRTGVAWEELDQRRMAPEIDLPVLLIAGTGDDTVPVELVDAFADRLPREPRYLRLDGVEHMEAWNAAPGRYREAVREFLADQVTGAAR